MGDSLKAATALARIKLLHTAVWIFFVACIALIPVAAVRQRFDVAAGAAALVLLECAVLAYNRWSCPLTAVAARYTDARDANFDIYLPRWLARYNKEIFGSLFIAGSLYALGQWLVSP